MRARFRIWFVIFAITTIVFVLQTFFAAEIEALIVEYGRNEYVESAARIASDAVTVFDSLVATYWPDGPAFIKTVPDFWWGALTVFIIWGLLEMIYAASRRFRYGAGEPKLITSFEIEEARVLLNQRKEFLNADARRALASALDDLYAEGVKRRDSLIPPLEHFNHKINFDKEDARLEAWNQQTLKILDHPLIAVADRSHFRTLDSFEPEVHPMAGKSPRQERLEAVWTEKLRRLRGTIDSVGGETTVTGLQPIEQAVRGRQLASSGTGGRG
jgi:hypothetical protein